MLAGIRHQRHEAGALDCHSQPALMLGAQIGLAARSNLTTLSQKATECVRLLVIHLLDTLGAENARSPCAYLLLGAATARTSGAAGASTRRPIK